MYRIIIPFVTIVCLVKLAVQPASGQKAANPKAPNVIFVLIDDQGIGDLACEGNPWIKTPNIDAFYQQSVRLTNFHVSPLCTPTRSALMTGQYPINNGAWATFKGRASLSPDSPKLASLFRQKGYATGMFGKWHMGDNYPARPNDCGFQQAVYHNSGGAGELSDYWGNDYFDDTYLVNGKPRKFQGYCTEIWFDEAMKFIRETKEKPFFVYLPTNLVHDPLYIADSYVAPYKPLEKINIPSAKYYGMVANVDENMGRLMRFLVQEKLVENTIVIFATDNGTRNGFDPETGLGYNAGYRGIKGSPEEGGHRVPFYIRWPQQHIEGGKDINELTAHVDVLPTLAALCQLDLPENVRLDGVDISPLLLNKQTTLNKRTVFVHYRQNYHPPKDVAGTCIITGKWRLINGLELFDIEQDKGQKSNVASQYPDVVKQLLAANKTFVERAKQQPNYQHIPPTVVGVKNQPMVTLTIQHAVGDDGAIYKQVEVADGVKNKNDGHELTVATAGTYRLSCRRWPLECPGPITGIPTLNPESKFTYKPIVPEKARIRLFDKTYEQPIREGADEVVFEVSLPVGTTRLTANFIEGQEQYGVYYVYVEKM